ncbi:hypothetical protein CEUSTIGMA_g4442.t1 [Chlamydomonas eustigma]|uniref:Prenylcysteine lyase domain-containing protein n=1 Tax=Chlamydomonas eustigma TaxID=1157962 RepID=A0A250X1R3_9CHLO|nr:hypothetical protein CEUSTIGMA_g4442.t1 [Chlamydomonas eustigma]|eukprot:GAX76995.1 hypothetical protein CEUSTIGMA_g4442.t1 [Chlamydomonas eustigma]
MTGYSYVHSLILPALLLIPLALCFNDDNTLRGSRKAQQVSNHADYVPLLQKDLRVAVIGAGVGGAFAAFNIRKEMGNDTKLDVFESTYHVGGRAKTFIHDGKVLELGASIISDHNFYLAEAAQELNLDVAPPSEEGSGGFSIFDGTKIVHNQTSSWFSLARSLWKYGLSPFMYGRKTKQMFDGFKQIYDLQNQGRAFDSPESMLSALGIYNLTQVSCAEYTKEYLSSQWWSWGAVAFIRELVGAVNRCNYNQRNEGLNALAGLVSFLPESVGEVWAVASGNEGIPKGLLNRSKPFLRLGEAVTRIKVAPFQPEVPGSTSSLRHGFTLYTKVQTDATNDVREYGPYHAVILASPLEVADITFDVSSLDSNWHEQEPKISMSDEQLCADATSATQRDIYGDSSSSQHDADPQSRSTTDAHLDFRHPHHHHRPGLCSWVRCAPAVNGVDGDQLQNNLHGAHLSDYATALDGALTVTDPEPVSSRGMAADFLQLHGNVGKRGEGFEEAMQGLSKVQNPAHLKMEASKEIKRTYQRTVTAYIQGRLNATYFGAQRLQNDFILFTNDADTLISAISPRLELQGGDTVYKVFSSEPLDNLIIQTIFGEFSKVLAKEDWRAYPHFQPPEVFTPFKLIDGFCYVNTIENAASAMEMSAIGGRNCALMTSKYLGVHKGMMPVVTRCQYQQHRGALLA